MAMGVNPERGGGLRMFNVGSGKFGFAALRGVDEIARVARSEIVPYRHNEIHTCA